jgi:hypothetical protein
MTSTDLGLRWSDVAADDSGRETQRSALSGPGPDAETSSNGTGGLDSLLGDLIRR